ncbi:Seipin-1 [Mucuna pruriens]|uniref:Seipin-1 n=1 Tax=Mucuna pruriens TaxID=157652 RepID=A0A371FKQ4_MUCPR|nr:Seipin-1 [Mucuna pruriens]
MEERQKECFILPTPLVKLISSQTDLIYNGLASVFSPIYSLFSVASNSYHRAEESRDIDEPAAQRVPSQINHGSTLLLKKLGLCFLSAAYVCMVLFLVLILATVVGVGLVRLWVEEPVSIKENLHFDYTEAHPSAVFLFNGVRNFKGHLKKKQISVPVGHTFLASLVVVMPESDFNRELGMFQLTAELLSVNGSVIAKSSQPCMLRFRSSPIRLARTAMMSLPLVLGISGETQNHIVELLRHKEDYRRSNAIKVTLHPRAGTTSLPQLYEAEIVIKSHLPWIKELVRNWKWTFYVWVSLYIYTVLLVLLLFCYKPLIFLVTPEYFRDHRVSQVTSEEPEELQGRELGDESEVSELLSKWKSSRSKRKTILARGCGVPETFVGSSASNISMTTREDVTSVAVEDDVDDSESVCTASIVDVLENLLKP